MAFSTLHAPSLVQFSVPARRAETPSPALAARPAAPALQQDPAGSAAPASSAHAAPGAGPLTPEPYAPPTLQPHGQSAALRDPCPSEEAPAPGARFAWAKARLAMCLPGSPGLSGRLRAAAGPVLAAALVLAVRLQAPQAARPSLAASYQASYSAERRGNYPQAIQAMSPVIKAWPRAYTPNLRLGWLHLQKKDYPAALGYYQTAAQAAPAALDPLNGQTAAFLALGRLSQAAATAQKALTLDPANSTAALNLCTTLRRQGNPAQSAALATGMLALTPTSVPFLLELALAKQALGETQAAAAIMQDVLILEPGNTISLAYSQQMAQQGWFRNKY